MQFAQAAEQATEQFSRLYDRSRPVIERAADRTKHLYEDAREWVPEHQGTVATVSAIAVGACMSGYLIGRSARERRTLRARAGRTVSAIRSQVPDVDLRPFFRFVSLWMLYRVATKD
jgi:hypothetical protein